MDRYSAVDTFFVIRSNIISGQGNCAENDVDACSDETSDVSSSDRRGEPNRERGDVGPERRRELRSGMAVVRDLRAFAVLDVDLHEELLLPPPLRTGEGGDTSYVPDCSSAASSRHVEIPALPIDVVRMTMTSHVGMEDATESDDVGAENSGVAKEQTSVIPCSVDPERTTGSHGTSEERETQGDINLCDVLSEYLSSLLEIPDVMGSDAMARFLEQTSEQFVPELESKSPGATALGHDLGVYGEHILSMIVSGATRKQEVGPSSCQEVNVDFNERNFADYIFQGDVDEMLISIPRREYFDHSESLPAGWWLVWQYHVQTSGPPVEFSVFLQNDDDGAEEGGGPAEKSGHGPPEGDDAHAKDVASSSACVVRETVSQASDVVRGSYRCEPDHRDGPTDGTGEPPPRTTAVLRFSNVASLLRGAQLQLAVRCVPHEAFKAACKAAEDQLRADQRRRKSPLLRQILDSSYEDPVRLVVEPASRPSPEDPVQCLTITGDRVGECDDSPMIGTAHSSAGASSLCGDAGVSSDLSDVHEQDTGADGASSIDVLEGNILTMRKEIAVLRSDRNRDRGEIARLSALADSSGRKLEFLNAEKRVWLVTKREMQEDLSNSSMLLDEERKKLARCEAKLEEKTKEALELKSEVDFLRGQIPTEAEIRKAERDLIGARSETKKAHDMIDLLRRQLSELKRGNETLSAELRERKNAASDALLDATAEADEARMMQRILEGKVREMERLLVSKSRAGVAAVRGGSSSSSSGGGGGKRGGVVVTEATDGTNAGEDITAAQCTTEEGTVKRRESSRSNGDAESRHDPPPPSNVGRLFEHPDPRINAQLIGLRERHGKLTAMSRSDPENERDNAELIGKIESAIEAIISSATAGEVRRA